MLQSISWAEYLSFIFILLLAYYAIIIYTYFKTEALALIGVHVTRPSSLQLRMPAREVASNADRDCPTTPSKNPPEDPVAIQSHLLDELKGIFHTLSWCNPGNKTYVLDSVQRLFANPQYQRLHDSESRSFVTSEIMRLAKQFCAVDLHAEEITAVLQAPEP